MEQNCSESNDSIFYCLGEVGMFSKILVANRGEVAVRIIRACREMGIKTVAVYSEVDKDALHVSLADESYCIGPAEISKSYLNEKVIIATANMARAQAIHPGYGFLSENAHFARLCRKNGLVFIGPTPEKMSSLENKALLKEVMRSAGLDVIKGSKPIPSLKYAYDYAREIGYPVMLKACSGGGGRGIRLVNSENDLEKLYGQSTAEALNAFGDGSLYLEQFIPSARHIEVQIVADSFGNVVCLGERDCSIQKNRQKLIEETPSPAINGEIRSKVIERVIAAVKTIEYVGVGTLEFLLDRNGQLWFMEMNIRLQVEHCVTEMLTGMDIVKWQIRIAAGVPLDFTQQDVRFEGASMECRINAEGPGCLKSLHIPGGPSVRFDTCLFPGYSISPFYDSLLGKMIVLGKTRDECLRKMRSVLCELIIEGIPTNIMKQLDILDNEKFVSGEYNINFFDK